MEISNWEHIRVNKPLRNQSLFTSRCLHYDDVNMNTVMAFMAHRPNTRAGILLACWFMVFLQAGGIAVHRNAGFHPVSSAPWVIHTHKLCKPGTPARWHELCAEPSHACTCITSCVSVLAATLRPLSAQAILVMVLAFAIASSFPDTLHEPPLRPPTF